MCSSTKLRAGTRHAARSDRSVCGVAPAGSRRDSSGGAILSRPKTRRRRKMAATTKMAARRAARRGTHTSYDNASLDINL